MSCRMSAILLKHWSNKCYRQSIYLVQSKFSSLTTSENPKQKQNFNEAIQVSNNLKPLISLPVNEILSSVNSKQVSGTESVTVLKALRMHTMFNKIPPENFKSDDRFKLLCEIFNQNCKFLDINLLISGLRSLLEIGMPADYPCVVNAEKRVLKSVDKMSCFQLIQCLYFHHRFKNSNLQSLVVNALHKELIEKLDDVCTPSEILLLSQIFSLFDEKEQNAVAQKIVEFISLLSMQEMCKVVSSLAQKSNRNTQILNSIAFHMRMKQDEVLGIKETIDLLYAFKKLNFFDMKLLFHLSKKVVVEIPEIKQSSVICGLLTVCGHLKLKDIELLDSCTEWMLGNLKSCGNREFISFILTSAALNYSTYKSKDLLKSIVPKLTALDKLPPNVLLNVAWSLAILNCIPKSLLLSVLSENFYKPLLDDPDIQKRDTNALKLMNLKGVLKIQHPECLFTHSLFLEPIKLKESSDVENSRRHVINILSNFVPKEKCLSNWQSNDLGIFIDAEFIMDRNIRPLSIKDYGIMAKPTNLKSLPKGAKRIALQVMFHKDFTLGTVTYTGINALSLRLLSHCGYSVLRVSFDDFMKNKTEVQKARYLNQKIQAIFKNTEKSEM